MARRLLQRKNRKHPEPLHDSIRRGKSRVNENRFNVPVARARDADNALRPSTRWWMSFYPACPRAESWLSSKDPTICKPELGRTPTIHRFFRFTPAQSCILIRADFIRNAWQLNECLRIFWQFLQILELCFFLFLLYFSELSTRFDEIYDKISICNF